MPKIWQNMISLNLVLTGLFLKVYHPKGDGEPWKQNNKPMVKADT